MAHGARQRPLALQCRMDETATALQFHALCGSKGDLKKLLNSADCVLLEAKDKFGRTPLFYSVMGNDEHCLALLLKAGARADNSDNDGQTPLHLASYRCLKGCVKLLLSAGASWRQKDVKGITPLHLAAHHPNPKALALILEQIPLGHLDQQDNCKRTALHWSASFCVAENIRMLLEQGANVFIQDEEGKTPLHLCVSQSDPRALECAHALLENSPSLINWQDYNGQTALHLAVASGVIDVVDFLTSRHLCDVNLLDNLFRTPLHWAVAFGKASIAELLLDRRADASSADGNGATPLHYAAQKNDASTVSVLLSRGSAADKEDSNGLVPLLWAAAAGATDVVRILRANGVTLETATANATTPLHAAAAEGRNGVVELLLDVGCAVDPKDYQDMTPLAHACKEGHAHTIPLLLDAGASLQGVDFQGRSPLHWAAQENHAYVCQLLIRRGCCTNIQDDYGRTPLHYASYWAHLSCMSVLLENAADPNIADNEGKTALQWASKAGSLDAVELLCNYQSFVNSMDETRERHTALDYAIMGGHAEVIQFLLDQGAFTSGGIQDIAARIIQTYFKKLCKQRPFGDVAGAPVENARSHTPEQASTSSSSASHAMEGSALEDNHRQEEALEQCPFPTAADSRTVCNSCREEQPSSISRRDAESQTSECHTNLDVLSSGNCSVTPVSEEDAALTIQRAWQRYTRRQMFIRMQQTALMLFESEEQRQKVTQEWQQFLERLKLLGFDV